MSTKRSDQSSFYQVHPLSCADDDFWGQVRRTHNGQPVGDEQIAMIVKQMIDLLKLNSESQLLDLCCGNGALSVHWFQRCAGGLGVDFSEPLLRVAGKYFSGPAWRFVHQSVLDFVEVSPDVERFDRVSCYGSLQYLQPADVERLLLKVNQRFMRVERFVVGNLPDLECAAGFFARRGLADWSADDPNSAIGVWWSREAVRQMANRTGWAAEFATMPKAFYAHDVRFDVVLTRRVGG